MAELTINKALVVQKSIRARISELTTLRSEVSTTDEFYGDSGKNRVKIPNYSVTRVDTKISELEAMLFDIDAAIKDIRNSLKSLKNLIQFKKIRKDCQQNNLIIDSCT